MFDSRTGEVLEGTSVAVRDGIIRYVGDEVPSAGATAGRVLEAGGRLLTPGFIDTHAHSIYLLATSFTPGGGGVADLTMDHESIAAYRRVLADAYLPHGVTVVRDAGTSEEYLPMLRAWAEPDASAPDFYPCGGALVSHEAERVPYSGHRVVADSLEAAEVVRGYREAGFRHVKLYWRLQEPEFRAALREAESQGMVPFAHVDRGVVTIDRALALGLRHFEHAFTLGVEVLGAETQNGITFRSIYETLGGDRRGAWFMSTLEGFAEIGEDSEELLALVERLAAAGASVTPTIHVVARPLGLTHMDVAPIGDFDDTSAWTPAQLERARRGYEVLSSHVGLMHEAGVQLSVGTDTVDPGEAVLSEMLMLHGAGIPMADVLAIATLGGAEVIELADLYGTIEVGKRGHLVLFDESPLRNPEALLGGKTVIKDGAVWEGRDSAGSGTDAEGERNDE